MDFVTHNLAAFGAAALAILAVSALVYKTISQVRRIGHFLDDWFGEAERPGVEARPGVTARRGSRSSASSRSRAR